MEGRSNKIRVSERTKIFGDNLERARKRRGMTRQQLAEAVGINERTLSAYALGRHEPNLEKIFEFARVLGVSINSLTGDAEVTDVFEYRLARAKKLFKMAGGAVVFSENGACLATVKIEQLNAWCRVPAPTARAFVEWVEGLIELAFARHEDFNAVLTENVVGVANYFRGLTDAAPR